MKSLLIFLLSYFVITEVSATILPEIQNSELERAFNTKAKPVFAKYCASCHADAGAPDYTDFTTAVYDRGVIYNRVFVVGDMPWRLRISSGDKAKLRSWLTMEQ